MKPPHDTGNVGGQVDDWVDCCGSKVAYLCTLGSPHPVTDSAPCKDLAHSLALVSLSRHTVVVVVVAVVVVVIVVVVAVVVVDLVVVVVVVVMVDVVVFTSLQ